MVIFALEIAPMLAFVRRRRIVRRGGMPDISRAPAYARTSMVQAVCAVLRVLTATAMARGFGMW